MGKLTKHESPRVLACGPRVIALAAFAASTLVASAAFACGGFFCSTTQPVEQTGEEILFAVQADGMLEAHVRVEYEGPSDQFAWIVPTPSLPEVGLSSERLFDAMESTFGVQFEVNWQISDNCLPPRRPSGGGGSGGSDVGVDVTSDTGASVSVVLQDGVGPYEYVVLQATDTDELFEWLNDNGYQIPADVAPFVDPYVLMGNDVHFVAFRLTKTADAGEIQPILLRYAATEPMVPIQLTAVATAPDLGVTVNVLGRTRAVPNNYMHVHINELRLDWLRAGNNYNALVTEAMNEAGGQGFVTQYAGSSRAMQSWLNGARWFRAASLAQANSRAEFLAELQSQGFSGNSQIRGLLQRYMPVPDAVAAQGVSAQNYYNCIDCYGDDEPFDAAGLAAAIEERIVEPLMHVQGLFEELPYLSRMYTTLSAEEMSLDPSFVFNSDMGDVSNEYSATVAVDCSDGGDQFSNAATVTLADGRSWMIPGSARGTGPLFIDLPAAAHYEETAPVGAPQVVVDNSSVIRERLSRYNLDYSQSDRPVSNASGSRSRWGCSVGPRSTSTSFVGLAGLALFAVRRRRR